MLLSKKQLIEMYLDGFPEDGRPFAKHFVEKAQFENTVTYDIGGEPVSVGYIVPKNAMLFREQTTVGYLSALSTVTSHRGNGYIKNVIKKLLERCSAFDYPLVVLSPFSPTYYHKYSFVDASYCGKTQICLKDTKKSFLLGEIDYDSYVSLYDSFSQEYSFRLRYTKREFNALMAELSVYGGKLLGVYDDTGLIGWIVKEGSTITKYATAVGYCLSEINCLEGLSYLDYSKSEQVHTQVRIANAVMLFGLAEYKEDGAFSFKLTDDLIDDNNAYYCVEVSKEERKISKMPLADAPPSVNEISVAELTKAFLDGEYPFVQPTVLLEDKY